MKGLLGLYGATVVVACVYFNIWGMYAYKGFAYNLGRSLFWPAAAFPVLGKIVGGILVVLMVLFVVTRKAHSR